MTDSQFADGMAALGEFDFLVSCCFDRFFTSSILSLPRIGAVNLHPSPLPSYRGVKPLENAIVAGDTRFGVTLHVLTEGIDDGDIILKDESLRIASEDLFGDLFERQSRLAGAVIARFFEDPANHLRQALPQDEAAATPAPRMPFVVEPSMSVREIRALYAQARGLGEQPGT
jgi:methionyl-tRNA formyltransferase